MSVTPVNIDKVSSFKQFSATVQKQLPRGIVPADSEVRIENPPRCSSPVIWFASHKGFCEQKPIPLITPKVEVVTFAESIQPLILEVEDFGHLVDPLVDIETETVEVATSEAEADIVEIVGAEADVNSETELHPEGSVTDISEYIYSDIPLGDIEPCLEADSTVGINPQVYLGDPTVSIPDPISPIARDSEAEHLEILQVLQPCKPT